MLLGVFVADDEIKTFPGRSFQIFPLPLCHMHKTTNFDPSDVVVDFREGGSVASV